jgi:ribonuclease HII
MDHRTIPSMTITRIREELASLSDVPVEILDALRRDRRSSVRALADKPPGRTRTIPERDMLAHENELRTKGKAIIAGVDEAGRGPLAGPVVAAAVILPPDASIPGLTDSKKLTAQQREDLLPVIRETALAIGVGRTDVDTIDQINILQATLRAMRDAIADLGIEPDHVIIDGNFTAGSSFPESAIVKGDALSLSIAAASVIAKTDRDAFMIEMDARFPGYGFAKHKGYGTPQHHAALKKLGPCPIHRRSFFGVMENAPNRSKGYEHMVGGIRAAETQDDLEAVGKAIRDQVDGISEEELQVLRTLYKRRLNRIRRDHRERE